MNGNRFLDLQKHCAVKYFTRPRWFVNVIKYYPVFITHYQWELFPTHLIPIPWRAMSPKATYNRLPGEEFLGSISRSPDQWEDRLGQTIGNM